MGERGIEGKDKWRCQRVVMPSIGKVTPVCVEVEIAKKGYTTVLISVLPFL